MKIEFTDLTLDGVQKRVEDWLDQNWDAERGCRKGQSTFNKQSWFTMDDNKRTGDLLGMKAPAFDREEFEKTGRFTVGSSTRYPEVMNYDWNPARKEGVLYWQITTANSPRRVVYRVTFYESDNKLNIAKIEEVYDKTGDDTDITTLPYTTDISHYYPSKNLPLFWDSVLEHYNK